MYQFVQKYVSGLAFAVFFAFPVVLVAQGTSDSPTPEDMGLKPFGAYHGGNFDTVSMSNGNLFLKIPLFSVAQRGSVPLNYSLYYNTRHSKTYKSNCSTTPPYTGRISEDTCTTQISWEGLPQIGVNPQKFPGVSLRQDTWFGSGEGPYETRPWTWCPSDAGQPLYTCFSRSTVYVYQMFSDATGALHVGAEIAPGVWRSYDGSGFYYEESTGITKNSSGMFTKGQNDPTNCSYDSNGNCVGQTADTLNRPIPAQVFKQTTVDCPPGPRPVAAESTVVVPSLGTSNQTYIFCYTHVTVMNSVIFSTTDDPTNTTDSSGYFLQSVKLPDGTVWQFDYYDTTGDLKKITLPLGGSISYETTQTTIDEGDIRNIQSGGSSVVTRTVNADDGTPPSVTHYAYDSSDPYSMTTTVTDAMGNDTVTHLVCFVDVLGCSLYPASVSTYSGTAVSGELLRTVATEYQVTQSLPTQGGDTTAAFPTRITTTLDNGLVSKKEMTYDAGFSFGDPAYQYIYQNGVGTVPNPNWAPNSGTTPYGKVLTESEYDYGLGSPGPLLRRTVHSYQALNSPIYLQSNLLDLPSQDSVYDGSGNLVSQTTYNYDEGSVATSGLGIQQQLYPLPAGAVRGNLTSKTVWASQGVTATPNCPGTGLFVTTSATYYDSGEVSQSLDACNQATTFTYDPQYLGAYPTSVQNALGQTSFKTYDFNTGLVLTSTDPNSNTTTYNYNDPLTRLTDIYTPDVYPGTSTNGHTGFVYTTNSVQINKLLNPSESITTLITVDGLGRKTTSALTSDPAGTVYTTQSFDTVGHVGSTTSPSRCSPGGACSETTAGTTQFSYDALGRKLGQTNPDGTTTSFIYTGNVVDSWDENGTHMQHTTDALGRLTKVMELGTAADPRSLETDYTYDALGNLKYVNQQGATGETPRTRSFTYDSLSRLITSQNPETGTICYGLWSGSSCTGGYDANGNLLYKTDANGLTTSYTYDALNRVLTKNAADNSTNFNYTYDQCFTGWWFPCSNPIGRLVGEGTPDGIAGTIFAYDAMGRTTNTVWWRFEYPGWYGGLGINYDLAGNPVWIGYPDSHAVTQSYDAAGRLTTVTDATTEPGLTGGGTVYFSNPQYTAAGALASATYGNGVTENITYNSRLQPCHTMANSPALPPVLSPGGSGSGGNVYDRLSSYAAGITGSSPCGAEPGNNGNIAYIADNVNPGWTQSFTYDGLNRLTSAFRSDGAYNHTYNYDSFGNLLAQDNVNSNPSYSIDSATNRLNRWNGPVNLYSYDAAGNLISSGTSDIGGHTFTYNASSQITAVDNGSTATYLYNGIGERTNKATPSGWTAYIYLNGQPMSENSIINGTGDWTDYIYANGQKIARVTTPIYGGASTTNYYLDDHLGTTQVELDASGNVTWQGQFTPFGTELPDGSTSMHYKFTGKERDAETGLDYFGARYYGSAMGRWVSPDWALKPEAVPYSKLDDPQSLNLYGYVGNNPLSKADLDGHCFPWCAAIAPEIVEAGTVLVVGTAIVAGTEAYFSTPAGQRSLSTFSDGVTASASHSIGVFKGWVSKDDKAAPAAPVGTTPVPATAPATPGNQTAAPGAGSIYVVPGSATASGKPYIGRHHKPNPARTRRSNDGRDRSKAVVVDTYDASNVQEGREKEQEHIDTGGGKDNLDNKRDEIKKDK